jgi:hypothetical protein
MKKPNGKPGRIKYAPLIPVSLTALLSSSYTVPEPGRNQADDRPNILFILNAPHEGAYG